MLRHIHNENPIEKLVVPKRQKFDRLVCSHYKFRIDSAFAVYWSPCNASNGEDPKSRLVLYSKSSGNKIP